MNSVAQNISIHIADEALDISPILTYNILKSHNKQSSGCRLDRLRLGLWP